MVFEGFIQAETQRAYLFHCHYWESADWMPKSQVDTIKFEDTHEVVIIASSWICNQKNIDEFTFVAAEA
jgi:hypothetical protein